MQLSCLPVSLFQAIVDGDMHLGAWLDLARAAGLDGVECSLGYVEPLGRYRVEDVARQCREAGLAVSMVTCHPDFTHPDRAVRAAQVDEMARNLDICRALGAPLARVLTGQRHPGVTDDDGVAWAIEGLRRVDERARMCDVRLALENHTKSFFWQYMDFAQRGAILRRVLDGLGDTQIGVNFDTANPLVSNEDPLALFEQLADRLAILHVADVPAPGTFTFCRIGRGIAPIAEVFRRARRRGFDDWVSIEEASRSGLDAFAEAATFVRRTWADAAP